MWNRNRKRTETKDTVNGKVLSLPIFPLPLTRFFFCLSRSSRIFLCWSIFPEEGLLKAAEDEEDEDEEVRDEETVEVEDEDIIGEEGTFGERDGTGKWGEVSLSVEMGQNDE